jgi:hypothetical protein
MAFLVIGRQGVIILQLFDALYIYGKGNKKSHSMMPGDFLRND